MTDYDENGNPIEASDATSAQNEAPAETPADESTVTDSPVEEPSETVDAEETEEPCETFHATYTAPQYTEPPKPSKPPKKKGSKVAVIVAVCILLVLVLFATVIVGSIAIVVHYMNGMEYPEETVQEVPDDTGEVGQNQTSSLDNPGSQSSTPLLDSDISLSVGDSSQKYSMTEVAAKTVNSIVEIQTEVIQSSIFSEGYTAKAAGSGIIVSSDGYIATNYHVVEDSISVKVTLRNGETYDAEIVGVDKMSDIAVIKINETGLSPVTFGDSDKIVIAESVIAIGNPLGELGGSVTDGIISALSRSIVVEDQLMTLLQTTAAVNPGNSGGGLFNMSGELIGVVNAKSIGEDIEGIAYAIPSNTAKAMIEDIIHYGYVKGRVQLGISTVDILDNMTARQYRVEKLGVYVYSVVKGSDAEIAGLKSGDLIVTVKGTSIESTTQLSTLIQSFKVGDEFSIVVYRNNENQTLKVTLTEYKSLIN